MKCLNCRITHNSRFKVPVNEDMGLYQEGYLCPICSKLYLSNDVVGLIRRATEGFRAKDYNSQPDLQDEGGIPDSK